MIRIIKEGNYKRITCETCGAVLAYNEKEDISKRTGAMVNEISYVTSYIECPLCGNSICCGSQKIPSGGMEYFER